MNNAFLDTLKQYWGFDDFRGIQAEIINSISQGHDTLGLMPTGGGKSITFQVPALCMPGTCIVITPLIALMKDQVEHLKKRGIKALALHSGMSHSEIVTTLENCIFGNYKFLYVSPERLTTPLFIEKIKRIKVSFITVDEAHCISQWGYDFRPAYTQIAHLRALLPGKAILALTATATPQVVNDIQQQLAFKQSNVFKMSFARHNLAYVVRYTGNYIEELLHIIRSVPGQIIIYTISRNNTHFLSQIINEAHIPATFYHAGLSHEEKDEHARLWTENRVRVIVATNAFGMGIDKPDVRLVLHANCPSSLEAYFQEAGRAGRDGKKAYAVLLTTKQESTRLTRQLEDAFPSFSFIASVYEHVCSHLQIAMGEGNRQTKPFNIEQFTIIYQVSHSMTLAALQILGISGYLKYEIDNEQESKVKFLLTRDNIERMNLLEGNRKTVLETLLRTYPSTTDYEPAVINESRLATDTGLTAQEVILALQSLSALQFINYTARSQTPTITILRNRVEKKYLVITQEAYGDRKKRMKARIDNMLQYIESHTTCRSQILLSYFGENSDACGQCDVCISKKKQSRPKVNEQAALIDAILSILSDGAAHNYNELLIPSYDIDFVHDTIAFLHEEGIIEVKGFHVKEIK